jgi:hypothetical protein
MSLTIIQQPNSIEYGYQGFYFVLSGTNSSQTSYKYVVDVTCSNIQNNLMNANELTVERFRIPQRINTQLLFTPFAVLKSYFNPIFTPTISAITENVTSVINYNLKFGEEYYSGTGITTFPNIVSYSGTSLAAVRQYEEVYDLNLYNGSNHNAKFLTDWSASNSKSIYENEYETLSFLDTASAFKYVVITTKDASGATVGVYTLSASTPTTAISWDLPTGTQNLNVSPKYNSVVLSADTIINSNVESYSIVVWDNGFSNQLSETFTYSLNRECTDKFGKTRIAWLNRKGKYDYFTFPLKRIDSMEVTRNEWQPHLNYNYQVGDRGRSVLNVVANKKFTVTSDWLTDNEATYLERLVSTRDAFLIDATGRKIPLIITAPKDWLTQNTNNDRLFNATLEFTFANDLTIQTS